MIYKHTSFAASLYKSIKLLVTIDNELSNLLSSTGSCNTHNTIDLDEISLIG